MSSTTRDTRRTILESAYDSFYREGFQRVSVNAVAETAGVTKRTLYNHFPSKDVLIAAVLEVQADLATRKIRRWCDGDFADPEELVGAVFADLRRWARVPDWRGSGFTRAAMELAWAPGHPARSAAAAQKRAVVEMLTVALVRAGAARASDLARELVVLIEGANALRLIHGDDAWFDAAETTARARARASGSSSGSAA
jgi:AcrR family transcriptional regulator